MNGWKEITLGEIMPERAGTIDPSKFPDEVFDLYSVPAFDNGVPDIILGKEIGSAKQVVQPGDVLLSKIVPHIRRAWIVGKAQGRRLIASSEWIVFRDHRFCPAFLRHVLVSDTFHVRFMSTVSGVGGSLLRARPTHVAKLRIPEPPLAEQQRIAAILDQADALRVKRRQALAKLDTLTRSLFLDLFGDPRSNPNNWPLRSLGSIGKVITGSTPPTAKEGMFGGDIPFITPGDLENDYTVKRTLTKAGAEESRTVRAGSTLVCCIGATIGKMGKALRPSAFNQQINAVEWSDEVNDDFGLATLRFFKSKIAGAGSSTTLPILKKSAFQQIEIPVPPITIQETFAKQVAVVQSVRGKQMRFQWALESLFASLQYRAFKGEL